MSQAGLQARRKRRRSPTDTGTRPEQCVAPNLLQREFDAAAPYQKWVADFTYIRTAEGWLYLALVLDLYSRRVVGGSMQSQMTAQWVATPRERPVRLAMRPGARRASTS
jgi:putative transposase